MGNIANKSTKAGILGTVLYLSYAAPALAQGMPVHDNASLIQQIQQVKQAVEIIEQGKRQIAEAKKLYDDLNGLTDISQLAQQLKSDALRQLDTSGGALGSHASGDFEGIGAVRARADEAYRDIIGSLGQGANDNERRYDGAFDYSARRIATDIAVAENIGAAVQSRQSGLEQLRDRLASAGTAKEVQDLSARLQAESALMANDQMRLEAIDRAAQAAQDARAAKARAARQKGAREDQAYFRGER